MVTGTLAVPLGASVSEPLDGVTVRSGEDGVAVKVTV